MLLSQAEFWKLGEWKILAQDVTAMKASQSRDFLKIKNN